MSSYVFMKVLESAPGRYDLGIRLLSRGGIVRVHEAIARRVAAPGKRILDIGCGTGGLARACAARGADVTGIDINPGMLDVARARPLPGLSAARVQWVELGAMEIEDRFAEEVFDAIVSCLVFSELTPDELSHVLRIAHTGLRAGGQLVVADEVAPATPGRRLWRRVRRLPIAGLTYLLTQATTRPLEGLQEEMRGAGFEAIETQAVRPGNLTIVSGRRPAEAS